MCESRNFEFPSEWSNDLRMNVLFAPFSQFSHDPKPNESKMNFWTNLIHNYCVHHKSATVSLSSLKNVFSRNGKTPSCLETVFEELKRNKKFVPASDYTLSSVMPQPLMSWLVNSVLSNTVGWTLNKFKSSNPQELVYVHVDVVKEISEELLNSIPTKLKGKLITPREIMKENPEIKSEAAVSTFLRPLVQQKKAAAALLPELVVKFPKNMEKPVCITECDCGIYKLQKNERILAEKIEGMEIEIVAASNKAREAVKNNRKPMALRWLRRKKELETRVEKLSDALDNMRSLLIKLNQTESDQLVLQSYEAGIRALKQTLADSGLTADGAEATMDKLQDVLDETRDIEETISRPLEDMDLEDELNALLQQEEEKRPGNTSGQGDASLNLPNAGDDELQERIKALAL